MEKFKIINMKPNIKKTMTTYQFATEYNIGINKAYIIVNHAGFPAILLGRKKLILRCKIDEWLELHIGDIF